jgi:hypothetical protein
MGCAAGQGNNSIAPSIRRRRSGRFFEKKLRKKLLTFGLTLEFL